MKLEMMVDIETWSKRSTAAIASIGAVLFHPKEGIKETFYRNVEITTCKDYGLSIDKDTLDWWAKQPKEVFKQLLVDRQPLKSVLSDLRLFYNSVDCDVVWCQGASFDFPILTNAYNAVGESEPWRFYHTRCSRTILSLFNIDIVRESGKLHNALNDAINQTNGILKFYEAVL